jgi:alpha-N-arabinofuranosidase
MYGAHVGGESVRTLFSAPRIQYQRVNATGSIWGLAGSASIKDRTLTITIVNPHVSETRVVEIAIRGASAASARALVLAAPDIHAHNTFESPRRVEPQAGTVDARQGGALVYEVRPASVTRLTVQLA